MHIDMDAFYASIEQRDDPSLKGRPVIIGGGRRGVVSAASYEARKYGVRSAMPIFQAKRLCPHGVYMHGRMSHYSAVSGQIMSVLGDFSPVVEPASIDEAYLDASGLSKIFGPVEEMGRKLKKAIHDSVGLTCSVGIAPVKFLAKIASDIDKPDALTILRPEVIPDFLSGMAVELIPGVGGKTLSVLHAMGIRFAGEVKRYPKEFWVKRMGKSGAFLFDRAHGLDPREVVPYSDAKSESTEHTFEADTLDYGFLKGWLLRQSEKVGRSLRKQGLAGRTVTLKVKYADFSSITRSKTIDEPTNLTLVIYNTVAQLFDALKPAKKLRLIGVGVSNFADGSEQQLTARHLKMPLFEEAGKMATDGATGSKINLTREAAIDAAIDKVRNKFGEDLLMRAKIFEQTAKKP